MPRPSAHATVFHAVADPTRRALLDLLRAGERPAGELAECFQMTAAAVSQHLKVLKEAKLVADRRVGRVRLYRLTPEPLREVEEWIGFYREFWPRKLSALGAYLEESDGEGPAV